MAKATTTKSSTRTTAWKDRISAARRAITKQGIDALIVSDPHDVGYLTGFLGGDSWLIIPSGRAKPILISDSRYEEDVEPLKTLCTIQMRQGAMTTALVEITKDTNLRVLGVQAEHTSLVTRDALAKALGAKNVKPLSGVIAQLRAIKDKGEISLLRKALKIQQDALVATMPTIKPGQSELEICARLEFEMKSRGSSDPSFASIVAAKANSSKPHATPGSTKAAANKPLLIDWGATWRGYHGDMCRTFCLGRWPKKIAEIYEIVREAHEAAAAAIAPGVTNHEVDAIARTIISKAGFGDRFGHGLGHGVGLDVHEAPGLGPRGPVVRLQPGHVVTVEPGIYLPGLGGVRIEDIYAVTPKGRSNLSSLPRDLAWSTL